MIYVVAIILGIAARLWAIKSMNGRFSLQIKPPEKLCTTGAYKYIRHPSYAGSWLILVGLFGLWPLAGMGYLAFVFFLSRAIQEEMLLNCYKEYQDYRKKTGMFLPKFRR